MVELKERKCPKCGQMYKDFPAISRRDDKTEICPICGVLEAWEDWEKYRVSMGGNRNREVTEG